MSRPSPTLRIMLIEDDPVVRQGFAACLNQIADLQVVLEADSSTTALQALENWFRVRASDADAVGMADSRSLDLVILSLDLGQSTPGQAIGLTLCQQIKSRYSTLPILLSSAIPNPAVLAAALQTGAAGYCQQGTVVADWAIAIRQVSAGYSYWTQGIQTISQALTDSQRAPATLPASVKFTPLAALRRNLHQSGLRQIDRAIAQLNAQLETPDTSLIDHLFLTGRRRELRAAHWLVNRLLSSANQHAETDVELSEPRSTSPPLRVNSAQPSTQPIVGDRSTAEAVSSPNSGAIALQPESQTSIRSIQAALLDATFAKLQSSLTNLTDTPLEIDILNEDKKRELLAIALRKIEDILDDLRFSQVQPDQLADKRAAILQDAWQTATTDFFGRYYTLQLSSSPANGLRQPAVEIVEVLFQDADIVQAAILDKIPLVTDFLAHLLFQTPLVIDNTAYAIGTVEAMARMEALLQNLMIQIANAVIQPLLNRFGDVVAIKQNFYDRRLLSTREIERFRNNLSWKYRVEKYFAEPAAIFESRYILFSLHTQGIAKTSIYAPRNPELEELAGIRFAVTLALEARDAIAPRLRSALSFMGSGVVYVLTEVIGRGIGLIGRGIIKGIGNALGEK
ncbi:MAG: DUF3685 domain-containing protein [Leptolyngbyaceae cyanobacterium RU_5_1]|nr:DUF3685 domain-containing protein [Leptolyngbyaceae cyanobacterium RU_5_1]